MTGGSQSPISPLEGLVGELLTCEHPKQLVIRQVGLVLCCGCGSYKYDRQRAWTRPELIEALAGQVKT